MTFAKFLRTPILKNVCDRLFPELEKGVVVNRFFGYTWNAAISVAKGIK